MRSAHESKHCHSFSKSCNITEPQFCFLRYLFVSEMLKLSLITLNWASLVAQMVKNLPVMQETQIWSLGWEDPLEKEMATHSSILAWEIPWTEEPGGLQSMGLQRVRHQAQSDQAHMLQSLTLFMIFYEEMGTSFDRINWGICGNDLGAKENNRFHLLALWTSEKAWKKLDLPLAWISFLSLSIGHRNTTEFTAWSVINWHSVWQRT